MDPAVADAHTGGAVGVDRPRHAQPELSTVLRDIRIGTGNVDRRRAAAAGVDLERQHARAVTGEAERHRTAPGRGGAGIEHRMRAELQIVAGDRADGRIAPAARIDQAGDGDVAAVRDQLDVAGRDVADVDVTVR
ncbi:hypothetical protein CEE97_12555, partial [Lactobacillus crispatus]